MINMYLPMRPNWDLPYIAEIGKIVFAYEAWPGQASSSNPIFPISAIYGKSQLCFIGKYNLPHFGDIRHIPIMLNHVKPC